MTVFGSPDLSGCSLSGSRGSQPGSCRLLKKDVAASQSLFLCCRGSTGWCVAEGVLLDVEVSLSMTELHMSLIELCSAAFSFSFFFIW